MALPLDGTFLVVLAIFAFAGFVKGMLGLGLPAIAVGLLGTLMAPAQAAAILIVPAFVTNVWQLAGPSLPALARRLATMMLGIAAGTFLGAGLITGAAGGRASAALGVALAAYAAFGLTGLRLAVAPRREPWLSPLIGAATGVISGATGVFSIPAVPYLQALGLEKDELVQALGLSFLVSTVSLGLSLSSNGLFGASIAGTSLMALAPALLGMALGQAVRTRISTDRFRRWFYWGLLLLGAHLALRGLA
ncbi:sulfite exporter TauE/SafE family protein [Salinarimonas soli]|uniref:Probable membrane transporter protein n=1 Tax=Salinarimonas soli TaxID=1638099 RepID=A0A5B2VE12_9HYPH|nr:sulfite exporter TauE/SafE family protein [Salinarimonas soli]KAA2236876.1 sulfite exporter TauE/SafE family protein [Salinarimonas soli]